MSVPTSQPSALTHAAARSAKPACPLQAASHRDQGAYTRLGFPPARAQAAVAQGRRMAGCCDARHSALLTWLHDANEPPQHLPKLVAAARLAVRQDIGHAVDLCSTPG